MLAAETGAARNTLSAYRSDLVLSSEFLDGKLCVADAVEITRLSTEWQELARASVARKAASCRRFFGFLVDEGHRADDPSHALPRPGTARRLPRSLDHADIDRLFAVLADRIERNASRPTD